MVGGGRCLAERGEVRARMRIGALVPLLAACAAIMPAAARAQSASDDIDRLRATLQQEIAALRSQEKQVHEQLLLLDRRGRLLDRQLATLRATGRALGPTIAYPSGAGAGAERVAVAPGADTGGVATGSGVRRRRNAPPAVAQATPPAPSAVASNPDGGASATGAADQAEASQSGTASAGEAAPIAGPSAEEQQARRVLQSTPTLSSTGGVLTPKGQFIIDPSIEYDYWAQNQLGLNGFTIIPGITFGNIYVNRVEQNITIPALTVRAGLTDRLEVNVKIPYVWNETNTNSLIAVGPNPRQLSVSASNAAIGDIQIGASYQINSGTEGWPVFVANLLYKAATGVSPFDVPIITVNDPDGQFLKGLQKKTATGTGFNTFQPNLTVLYPTAPGIFFANLLYVGNLSGTFNLPDPQGGPPTRTTLTPGMAVALTFGFGFALNDRASMSLSYQQEHVFESYQNGRAIQGSSYSFGSFNFGLGYALSERTTVNASVGIGVGPNAPAARLLIEVPYRFSL